jgi:HEPN domain-containing protein
MKPITSEWVDKAEGDWHSAGRELRARTHPNYDAACFHAQQCAEKYLKARLQEAGVIFARTHNLIALWSLALAVEPGWGHLQPHVALLTSYAVDVRYPGASASRPRPERPSRPAARSAASSGRRSG